MCYSLYEPNSHTLPEYDGRLDEAILRDSEILSEVNDAFCKTHPWLAQFIHLHKTTWGHSSRPEW